MESEAKKDFTEDSVLTGTPQPEMLVCWGRASWVVRLGLQTVGEGRELGLAVQREPEEAGMYYTTTEEVWEESLAHQRCKVLLLRGT